ncbi:MerR family transcriptional regulator [Oceanirhabdus seepicola]|uniref:MerR family transcriptional regulator n=1 Tax=Oceanirhabdus seepicola TaxID=2828781 RepID=A0A9J6P5E2_9CLOT|nr:MerR family transcriptional regulator [Oceanirhabdus seepicola]MCM1991787.1 MerR family transcriptional regulator [Oceanirhabdus seepicola]
MKEYYLIGEVAKIFDISADTLRHYDKIGLLKPIKLKNKIYRYYGVKQFDLLYMIQSLRLVDMSLNDIKVILYDKNLKKFSDYLGKQQIDIENQINDLIMMKESINKLKYRIDNLDRDINEIYIKKSPKMWAITMPIESDEDKFNLKNIIELNNKIDSKWASISDFVFFSRKKELLQHKVKYVKCGMISEYKGEFKSCKVQVIPNRLYAFSVYRGNYGDITDTYSKMIDWIDKNGYLIEDDAMEKSIISLSDKEDENEYIIEIWIPIKVKKS